MVGHYNKGMELHKRKMIRDIAPAVESNPSNHVEQDPVGFHLAEQDAHFKCAYRQEILAALGIVEIREPDRASGGKSIVQGHNGYANTMVVAATVLAKTGTDVPCPYRITASPTESCLPVSLGATRALTASRYNWSKRAAAAHSGRESLRMSV